MPRQIILFVAAALAFGASEASAAPVDWTLQDLTFTDGATATGSFELNVYGYLSPDWNLVTGDGTIPGWTYIPSINASIGGGETVVDFYRTGYDGYLQLAFASPLTIGPTDPLDYANSYECATYQSVEGLCTGKVRFFNRAIPAFVTDAVDFPVPEPAAIAVLGAGLAVIGAARRGRSKRP